MKGEPAARTVDSSFVADSFPPKHPFILGAGRLFSAAHAQTATPAKIGHPSAQAPLAALPETTVAEARLTASTKAWQSPYDELNIRYRTLVKDFPRHAQTLAYTAKAARGESRYQQLQSMKQTDQFLYLRQTTNDLLPAAKARLGLK